MIEVETPQEIEVVTNGVEVGARTLDVEVVDLSELDVTVAKREFVITGDDIYVPKLYDDAPQWMKDLVDIVVNNAMETGNAATLNEMASMLSQFAVSYVPLNQYTQSILDLSNEDARIHAVIETLNSNFNDGLSEANAQIINVQNTKASKDEVIAQVITTLSAQLANPTSELGATIGRIDQTIVDNQSANALSMQVLTSTLEGLGEDVSGNSTALQALSTYVGIEEGTPTGTGLLADVAILQKQNDGVIETYTGTYDVMIGIEDPNNNTDNDQLDATKEPYASWLAEDVANNDIAKRSAHVGDVYIKYSNSESGYKSYERAYKFIKTVVDGTSPYVTDSAGFTWSLIVDTDAQNAYVAALNAYDLADDKRRIFVGLGATSTPSVPYDQGDLWLIDATRTVNGYACKVGDILRCIESKGKVATYEQNDWVLASSYANAVAAEAAALETWKNTTYASTIATIQTQVDGKAETFYQSSIPTGRIKSINVPTDSTLDKYVGDLWKNTYAGTIGGYLGNNTEYTYTKTANGSNWNYDWTKMEVPDIVFDTIDTKKSIYSGNSLPVAVYPDVIELNDMWITGDTPVAPYVAKSMYVWSKTGSNPDTFGWVIPVKYTDDTATVALQNGLADGTTVVKLTNAYVGTTPLTTYITSEVDNKINVYSGETAPVNGQPSGVSTNDLYLWFTTASKVLANGTTQVYDITRTYKYSGSVWNEITTNSDITNLADLADGKRTVFSGSTVPVGAVERDIWIPSGNNGSYIKGEVYQYLSGVWSIATKYTADIQVLSANLQSQIDGKVDTYYQDTMPFANATNVAKKTQAGDYWYCTLTNGSYVKGKIYKYVESPNGSNYNYTWTENADVSKYVFDIADGKASIFTTASQPSAYKINDMMIVTTASFNNGTTTFSTGVVLTAGATRTSGFVPGDWTKKINDTEKLDAFVNTIYTPAIAGLQTQVDGQVSYYFYDSALGQTAASVSGSASWTTDTLKRDHNGDIAYDTTLEVGYWYDRTIASWVQITGAQNAGVIEALKRAAAAKEAVDSVVVSYYAWKQTTAPATQYKWMKDDNTLWEYVGSAWVAVDVKKDDTLTAYNNTTKDTTLYVHNGSNWAMITPNGIVANAKAVTDLNANLSSLGTTVSGHTSLLNTVDARIGSEGARVESRFAYNSKVNINGIWKKSGFGLTTNYVSGSGTEVDPYVSEFWIDASRFKFTNSNVTGSVAPFTIDASGVTPQITFNGKVQFSNVTGASSSANMLYNSAPAIGLETKGWHANYNDTGLTSSGLLAAADPYRPTGYGAFHQYINGTPAVGKVFDIRTDSKIPVIGGQYYEASAYLNTHRCNGQIYIGWMDAAGAVITWDVGMEMPQTNAQGSLANWGRVSIIKRAPANATSCYFYIRGISTGEANPYVFVSMCYFGRASENQNVISNWSEGISAGVSSGDVVTEINNGNTTTINGGRITTGSITANQIQASSITADKLNVSSLSAITANLGTITAGYLKNNTNTNYMNLNATGSNTFLNVNNKVKVLANGDATFSGAVISRDLVVAQGSGVSSLIYNTSTGQWYLNVTINTGLSGTGPVSDAESYQFDCAHTYDSITYSPYNYVPPGNSWGVLTSNASSRIVTNLTYITSTTHNLSWNIYLDLSFVFQDSTARYNYEGGYESRIQSITNFGYTWKIKKIT